MQFVRLTVHCRSNENNFYVSEYLSSLLVILTENSSWFSNYLVESLWSNIYNWSFYQCNNPNKMIFTFILENLITSGSAEFTTIYLKIWNWSKSVSHITWSTNLLLFFWNNMNLLFLIQSFKKFHAQILTKINGWMRKNRFQKNRFLSLYKLSEY